MRLTKRAIDRRPSARQRSYTSKWERESKAFLALQENRHCACGCGRFADMIDHRVPHKGDMRSFWDRSNWQPMNRRCNSRKAVLTEGAFGNKASACSYGSPGCTDDGTPRDAAHWWNRG
jgi:5-methylcytosine-specific restriction protein A